MKKLILIMICCFLSVAIASRNPIMHSYAKDTIVTKEEFQKNKKQIIKIVDNILFDPYNDINFYTRNLTPETQTVFEKSVARQLKSKNKLNILASLTDNNTNSLSAFTRENIDVIINALIEATDNCIPTNKYTGKKDRSNWSSFQVSDLGYIAYKLKNKYPNKCWEYIKPKVFTYSTNNFNNPAYYTILAAVMDLTLLTNKLTNDEIFFKEFRKYNRFYFTNRESGGLGGMGRILSEVYKHKSVDELELLLDEDWNYKCYSSHNLDTHYIDHGVLNAIYAKKTEKAYRVYEKFEKKRMASWNHQRPNYKDCIVGRKDHMKEFKKLVDKHERLRKAAEKGKSEKQIIAEYRKSLEQKAKVLDKMPLDTEADLNLYVAKLKELATLSEKYPDLHFYYYKQGSRISKEAKPELKEVYWKYMNKKEKKEETDFDRRLAATAGIAFTKVMKQEDLPKAFDYINKQRSWKLIDLLKFYKGEPPLEHKYASIAILQGLERNNKTNMIVYFIKRYKKIKDPDLRRGFLEMAPEYGLTNYPKPFYP